MNKEIEINTYRFINRRGVGAVPSTITIENCRHSFIDSGFQYLVQKGQHLVRLFDLSDGQKIYRLRYEDNIWTLVNIKPVTI